MESVLAKPLISLVNVSFTSDNGASEPLNIVDNPPSIVLETALLLAVMRSSFRASAASLLASLASIFVESNWSSAAFLRASVNSNSNLRSSLLALANSSLPDIESAIFLCSKSLTISNCFLYAAAAWSFTSISELTVSERSLLILSLAFSTPRSIAPALSLASKSATFLAVDISRVCK